MTEMSRNSIIKDSPSRSIVKAISWRLVASGTTFIVSFTIFTQATQTAFKEILSVVSLITAVDIIAKLILYYFHERLWANVTWENIGGVKHGGASTDRCIKYEIL